MERKIKPKKCKNKDCAKEFTPFYNTFQNTCSPRCKRIVDELRQKNKKDSEKRKKDSAIDVLVITFHNYIRLRDKGKCCPSCLKPWNLSFQAGHYNSGGGNSAVRFNEINVNGQCFECNSGSNFDKEKYRETLVKRWGLESVEEMELISKNVKRWSVDEIHELTYHFKNKINEIRC